MNGLADSVPDAEEDRRGSLRILGLVEGDPSSALSGAHPLAHFLFEALDRQYRVVQRLDYSPHGVRRLALAAATFRPSRDAWRARFHTSKLAHRTLSRTLVRRLPGVNKEFDLALQVLGWGEGQPRPYALFVDQTRLMAERGWPEWMPFTRRERAELLALERSMYRDAFHVFVMGRPARDSLIGDYGVDPSRVTVVGGGLSFETLPTPGEPSTEPTVLFVGRDFERKGGDCLIRAFDRVRREQPEAVLHLVGICDRVDVPGVIVHGKISDRRRLEELYRGARVFCLPSRYEPYGLVLIEAMAHGVPCIGTSVQAIPEILDQGRGGILVPPSDPQALAEALLRVLTDYELARELGSGGRRWMEQNLTWDDVVRRMAPVLSRIEPS